MPNANSPAEVLRAAIVLRGVGTAPGAMPVGVWPVYVGHMPDAPDNLICVYDTPGYTEGRIMVTGLTITKPGWQIRVRATDHPTAYAKMAELQEMVDGIRNLSVDIKGVGYILRAVNQKGGILALGQEPDAKKRNGFTLNGVLTHKAL